MDRRHNGTMFFFRTEINDLHLENLIIVFVETHLFWPNEISYNLHFLFELRSFLMDSRVNIKKVNDTFINETETPNSFVLKYTFFYEHV